MVFNGFRRSQSHATSPQGLKICSFCNYISPIKAIGNVKCRLIIIRVRESKNKFRAALYFFLKKKWTARGKTTRCVSLDFFRKWRANYGAFLTFHRTFCKVLMNFVTIIQNSIFVLLLVYTLDQNIILARCSFIWKASFEMRLSRG
jgi:hypothetical protein